MARLDISPQSAIALFIEAIVHDQDLPFQCLVPNEATQQAIREARAGLVTTPRAIAYWVKYKK